MTAWGWLSLAAAVLLAAAPSASVTRLERLESSERLGGRGRPATAHARERASRWIGRFAGGAFAALALVVAGAVAVVRGPLLGLAVAAALACGGVFARDVRRRRAQAAGRAERLAAVRLLVAELAAGARPAAALAAAGELGWGRVSATLAVAAEVSATGGDAGGVLVADPDPGLRAVGLAWRLAETTGVPLADVLGRVAADLAGAEDQVRAVAVALAGPRSSAVLLTLLPLIGMGMGTAMGARPLEFLGGPPAGQLICCLGVVLDAAGLAWMRRILRSAEPV